MTNMRFEARVMETVQRTPQAKSIVLERPRGFEFLPGQHMSIGLEIGGRRVKKTLSISSSPKETSQLELTKRLTEHDFANALTGLKVGDTVEIEGPDGDFTFTGEHASVLFITGGIGITPIRSMIRNWSEDGLDSQLSLIYSNTHENEIAFEKELGMLEDASHGSFKVFNTLTQPDAKWRGLTGRITADMIKHAAPDYADSVAYVSGPPAMVADLSRLVKQDLGLPERQIKTENFIGY